MALYKALFNNKDLVPEFNFLFDNEIANESEMYNKFEGYQTGYANGFACRIEYSTLGNIATIVTFSQDKEVIERVCQTIFQRQTESLKDRNESTDEYPLVCIRRHNRLYYYWDIND